VKTIVRTVLGMVLVLGWWSFTGNSISTSPTTDKIPASVWGGGAGVLEIEAETTTPARMSLSFSRDAQDEHIETYEDVPAGTFRWKIDVPSATSGYVELNALAPKPGDRVQFRILSNGRAVFEDVEQLDQPLEPGYAFFVQAYFDDYAKGKLSSD
jgi:hypothetical protein